MFEDFIAAQGPVYVEVLRELRAGRKQSHWMWFVFPQLRGLGRSPMAVQFGLADLEAARAYLVHPLLGARLVVCSRILAGLEGLSANRIFGSPDEVKLRASMTLFAQAAPVADTPFRAVLAKYFAGVEDPLTLKMLREAGPPPGRKEAAWTPPPSER